MVICLKQAGYHLIYSGTASMPKGFYWVVPVSDRLANGDLVEFSPPIAVRRFMIHKGWSNRELTLLKEVGATAGDSVCWQQGAVWINGQRRALIRKLPQDDRKFLPNLAGCIKLSPGWYLVLGTQSERSLDSRYFGIIPQTALRGRAIPLYIQQVGKSE